jgi:alpha-beta hydrolase superfamily lysophospholipase
MEHTEDFFEGVNGFSIYYQAWLPENPKAVVQIVHGFAEHSGRYMNVVNELLPLNYAIYADDHRGHGRSEGKTNYVDSFDDFIEDEKILHDIIRYSHPNLPIFMIGHSMGSLIAVCFTKKYEKLLKGLILTGTGTRPQRNVSKFLKLGAKIASKIVPKLSINPKLEGAMLSHDPEVVKAYQDDPLVHADKITTRLGYELIKTFENAVSFFGSFKLPLLVQVGSEDALIGGTEEELKNAVKMEDNTIKVYQGLYHEVYNEIEEERIIVLKDLRDWLENHIKKKNRD